MTGFKGTRNVNGRPKGAVNKTTAQTKNALQKIVSNELDKFDEMLEALDPKDRLEILIKILPFVLPKQTQIEIEANEINPFRPITINLLNEPLQIETNENTD
jgi:hypothetical protein